MQLIGARLRAARVTKRQTQVVVAGLSGITPDYLYQIGKKLPTIPLAIQLARVVGVPVSRLLEGAKVADRAVRLAAFSNRHFAKHNEQKPAD